MTWLLGPGYKVSDPGYKVPVIRFVSLVIQS